jgi:hypothetical protein
MDIIFIIIYGIALLAIIYYMIQLKPIPNKSTNVLNESRIWPWPITKYSFWKEWMYDNQTEEYDENDEEYKQLHEYRGNQHGGGYGYTGRQNPEKTKSFEGDHYGWDLDGGNYCGGGYGYTGRN